MFGSLSNESSLDKQKRGLYIVIEGQDGTGKTTQVQKLYDAITAEINSSEDTANPGKFTEAMIINEGSHENSGLVSTDAIGKIIKNRNFGLDNTATVLLFTAARCELWTKKILPCLSRNGVVISSRNWWSTLAFQSYGAGLDPFYIEKITRELLPTRYFKPDLAVILTLDDKERAKRQKMRGLENADQDTFEQQPDSFQSRVNAGYRKIATSFEIPMIDTNNSPDAVFEKICDTLGL